MVTQIRQASTRSNPGIRWVETRSNDRRTALIRRDLDDARQNEARGRGKPDNRQKYKLFSNLIAGRFKIVRDELGPWTPEHKQYLAMGLRSQHEVNNQMEHFMSNVEQALIMAGGRAGRIGRTSRSENPLFWSLRDAFVRGNAVGLTRELRYGFQSFVLRQRMPKAVAALQERVADLRFPYEWFPATRSMQRMVHIHVGPTNSGKTYRALQALERARTGIYAGPLRLLAHEIFSRFAAKGRPCALITGEEQRVPPAADGSGASGSYFQSCTVEMTPLNKQVDVAVIDEIQMMGDPDRGWAWTQAFLGVQAREVHVCGEERAVDLLQALCARMGDTCEIHRYERLSGLETMPKSLNGDFGKLRRGDAVVSFSRVGLHSLKAGIEKITGRRCAIVYGSLPPETRAQQAALFNDPDNDYDFLVASDAIGMGLNLEVRRVIFETATKHDGLGFRHLSIPEIKQIGGRAGRFRSATAANKAASAASASAGDSALDINVPPTEHTRRRGAVEPAIGQVSTLEKEDLETVRLAFQKEAPPLEHACVQPPVFAVEQFARFFSPETPFSFILQRIRDLAQVSDRFQLSTPKESFEVADIIQPYALSVQDRCVFITAPCSLRDPGQRDVLRAMARCVAEMKGGHLLDIAELDLEILDATRDTYPLGPAQYLCRLESLHKAITLYLWLSYRYVGIFTSQELAFHVKDLVEAKITDYLENLTFVAERQQKRAKMQRKLAEKQIRAEKRLLSTDEEHAPPQPEVSA